MISYSKGGEISGDVLNEGEKACKRCEYLWLGPNSNPFGVTTVSLASWERVVATIDEIDHWKLRKHQALPARYYMIAIAYLLRERRSQRRV
jgi:hypothetical protein